VWPAFVFEYLSASGIRELERQYADFKGTRRLPRVSRFSAEDFATVFVDRVLAEERTELLKRAA
jgi:hypothetical protein